jgi:hypothetical protein
MVIGGHAGLDRRLIRHAAASDARVDEVIEARPQTSTQVQRSKLQTRREPVFEPALT